jgi:hypothetical protein
VIALRGECFLDVWNDRASYFLDTEKERPVHSSPYVDAYASNRHNHAVFYRGIKIWDSPSPTLYRYNIKDNVTLTEDRTLKYAFQFTEALEKALITSTDAEYL